MLTVIIVAIGMIPGWHMGVGSALAGLFVADPTHVQAMFAANLLLLRSRLRCSSAAARGSTRAPGGR